MKLQNSYHNQTMFLIAAVVTSLSLFASKTLAEKNPKSSPHSDHGHDKHAHHKAHVHGLAKLSVALENENSGSIVYEAPSETVLGFEHKASTAKDKAQLSKVSNQLKAKGSGFFVFDPKLECQIKNGIVNWEHEQGHGKDSGEHSEVHVTWSFNCKNSTKGSSLLINLGSQFSRIEKLQVQVLGTQSQKETVVPRARGSVTL